MRLLWNLIASFEPGWSAALPERYAPTDENLCRQQRPTISPLRHRRFQASTRCLLGGGRVVVKLVAAEAYFEVGHFEVGQYHLLQGINIRRELVAVRTLSPNVTFVSRSLTALHLASNRLNQLPDSICRLKTLKILWLDHNLIAGEFKTEVRYRCTVLCLFCYQ